MELIKDNMTFRYIGSGGYQCLMRVNTGWISVRYGGYGLSATEDKPYGVWYPDEEAPRGEQTADDIWGYIRGL
jgi:hypothetical protein